MTKVKRFELVSVLTCVALFLVIGTMLFLHGEQKVWNGEEAVVVGGPGYECGVYLVSVVPIEPEKKPAPASWFVKATCSPHQYFKKGDKVRLYTKTVGANPTALVGEVY